MRDWGPDTENPLCKTCINYRRNVDLPQTETDLELTETSSSNISERLIRPLVIEIRGFESNCSTDRALNLDPSSSLDVSEVGDEAFSISVSSLLMLGLDSRVGTVMLGSLVFVTEMRISTSSPEGIFWM